MNEIKQIPLADNKNRHPRDVRITHIVQLCNKIFHICQVISSFCFGSSTTNLHPPYSRFSGFYIFFLVCRHFFSFCTSLQFFQGFSDILIHADRLSRYFCRCICFTLVPSVMDDISTGNTRPFSEAIADIRSRHSRIICYSLWFSLYL